MNSKQLYKTMKTINGFDDCLDYVSQLGFAGNGSLMGQQHNLCNMTDKLLAISGNETWFHKIFTPFKIRYVPSKRAFIAEDIKHHKLMVLWLPARYHSRERTAEYITQKGLCSGKNVFINNGRGPINDPYHVCMVCDPS